MTESKRQFGHLIIMMIMIISCMTGAFIFSKGPSLT